MSQGQTSFPTLSEGQKQCLRMVLGHLNSKEIGRELDISPHTVDQRLRDAMRALGAGSRFEAARQFAEYEGDSSYQPLIYQSPHVADRAGNAKLGASAERQGRRPEAAINGGTIAALDVQTSGQTATGADHAPRHLPLPRHRGDKNELGSLERLSWIIFIAIGSAMSFGGILAGLEALSRLRI